MKTVTLPLVSGNELTLFIGTGHLAVVPSLKDTRNCRVVDGLHNNGGWEVKLTAAACIKRIKDALEK